jgi:hypothetical protein
MFVTKNVSIGVGVTGRGNNGIDTPWFGFNYGSFLPKVWYNGGRFSRNEVVDVGWCWLCFHGSFTYWGTQK